MTQDFKARVFKETQEIPPSYQSYFEDGVVFALDAIWHDAEETPSRWPVIAVDSVGECMAINQSVLAAGLFNEYNVHKWCYLEDILPKE